MPKNKSPFTIRLCQFFCVIIAPFFMFMLLSVTLTTHQAFASSHSSIVSSQISQLASQGAVTLTSTLQNAVTLTETRATSIFSFSLSTLGYGETTLQSPFGNAAYSFKLPENWVIQTDGLLELELSYIFEQIESEKSSAQLGFLTVKLDDQTLSQFPITQTLLNRYQLRIPIPASKLAAYQGQYNLSLEFAASALCNSPNKATLIIHPTSTITLNYSQSSLVLDLARYPRPFFQPDFTPDIVRFVLPTEPTLNDAKSALGIAAKLGELSNNRQVISVTTDVDFRRFLATNPMVKEHLIVVGTPQNNLLLSILNDVTKLPVSLHQRQLKLTIQGPTLITPGSTFNYVFTITNTISREVKLSLVSQLSAQANLINCTPDCIQNTQNNLITWNQKLLGVAKSVSFVLTLEAADIVTDTFENTVILNNEDEESVNVATFTSTVVSDSSESKEYIVTRSSQDGPFFVYNNLAVAEGDGIIQEIPSPWSEEHAILLITGLNGEAVKKAGQAMSSKARLPGIEGLVALVQKALSPLEINQKTSVAIENTFADLGYQNKVVHGQSPSPAEYYFRVPYGWQLTDSAGIDLYFNHSGLIDYEKSGLTILLNQEPIGSVPLNEKTINDGYVHISLNKANIRNGELNRLSIQADMTLAGACVDPNSDRAWLVIRNGSKISLAHNDSGRLNLDLDYLPYPFHINPALANLLFALPYSPTVSEWKVALQVAASLGNSAAWKTLIPQVTFGNDLPENMFEDYQIIAIGRPSRNTLLQEVNRQLPQPFLPASDEIEQRLDDIVFRLPEGVNLGYIQLISSPWNESHAFMAVTGTTDQGMEQAAKILTRQPGRLKGNLALVKNDTVNTLDTRLLTNNGVAAAVATVVPEMTPMTIPTLTPPTPIPTITPSVPPVSQTAVPSASTLNSTKTEQPAWLMPLVGINSLLVIAILAFAFQKARNKRL